MKTYTSDVVWTAEKLSVVQYSNVQLDSDYLPETVVAASESLPQKVIEFWPSQALNTGDEVDTIAHMLQNAIGLEESGFESTCSDQTKSNNSVSDMNEFWVGNSVEIAESMACNEAKAYCSSFVVSTSLRLLCPETCGCASPFLGASGFFNSEAFGCPWKCEENIFSALDNFTCVDTLTTSVSDGNWALYVQGLKSVVLAQSDVQERSVPDFIMNDEFWESLANHTYQFAGEFVECNFLASNNATALFGINLCTTSEYTSLLAICPKACNCEDIGDPRCPSNCR